MFSSIKLFFESTKAKLHFQKNSFYFLAGYLLSVFIYSSFDFFKLFIGYGSFILVYSCVYVINDLFDLKYDRLHPYKKDRPIASNRLKPRTALLMCLSFYAIGLTASFIFINPLHFTCLVLLILGNVLYSHPYVKTKKSIISAGLILAMLQYTKLLAGWSINAGFSFEITPFAMIFACLYLYSLIQLVINSEQYKARFPINKREVIAGRLLMIIPAVIITLLMFSELRWYVLFTLIPIIIVYTLFFKKLKLKNKLEFVNRYMGYLNSVLIGSNIIFDLILCRFFPILLG